MVRNGRFEICFAASTLTSNQFPDNSAPTNVNFALIFQAGDISLIGNLQSQGTLPSAEDNRGRPRKRRDFFGTIKRRLGKSKVRSRSAGPGENDFGRDDSLNRSISADRHRNDDSKFGHIRCYNRN